MEACQLLTMMTALRRRNGLHRYVAEEVCRRDTLEADTRWRLKMHPGGTWVMGDWW